MAWMSESQSRPTRRRSTWVESVSRVEALLTALMGSYDEFSPQQMVNVHQLALQVGVGGPTAMDWDDPRLAAVIQGLTDLDAIGLVDLQNVFVRISPGGQEPGAHGRMSGLWEEISRIPLEPDQAKVAGRRCPIR